MADYRNSDDDERNIDDSFANREVEKAHWRLPDIFKELDKNFVKKMHIYQEELIKFNGRINLISNRSEINSDLLHFTDSIMAANLIYDATQQKEIYDVGSGAGFPGVVMAAMDSERHIVFLDKDARKLEFVKHICSRLELANTSFLHKRVEELPDSSVSCAVSRGFASISKSLMMLRKSCSPGAEYFHIKSDSWVREVAEIPSQICAHWEPSLIGDYVLPVIGSKYSVVLTKKL